MNKLRKLFRRIAETNIFVMYGIVLPCHLLWVYAVGTTLQKLGISFSQNVATLPDFLDEYEDYLVLDPICAVMEEAAFRWAPMLVLFGGLWCIARMSKMDVGTVRKVRMWGVAAVVLISSAIFGYVHGNIYNILIQGVGGVVFFLFYLRKLYRERLQGKSDLLQLAPLASSALYHLVSNWCFHLLD